MSPESVLATVAEVAIAIAGFGGVIAAIAAGRSQLAPQARGLFQALLLGSIALVVFSVVPRILAVAGFEGESLWRLASGLHAAYLGSIGLGRLVLQRAGLSPGLNLLLAFTIALGALQAANALWLGAAWVYLTVLLILVAGVFSIFPMLLRQIWGAGDP